MGERRTKRSGYVQGSAPCPRSLLGEGTLFFCFGAAIHCLRAFSIPLTLNNVKVMCFTVRKEAALCIKQLQVFVMACTSYEHRTRSGNLSLKRWAFFFPKKIRLRKQWLITIQTTKQERRMPKSHQSCSESRREILFTEWGFLRGENRSVFLAQGVCSST